MRGQIQRLRCIVLTPGKEHENQSRRRKGVGRAPWVQRDHGSVSCREQRVEGATAEVGRTRMECDGLEKPPRLEMQQWENPHGLKSPRGTGTLPDRDG